MKKSLYPLLGLLLCLTACLASCDETDAVGRYDNWQARNEVWLDSIAEEARVNANGNWERLLSYTITAGDDNGLVKEYPAENYVYVEKLRSADIIDLDAQRVHYTDTVSVHYRGKLMNGDVFDQSFQETELDEAIAKPMESAVSDLIVGFTTALQHMHVAHKSQNQWQYKGDRWRVYIPYQLAYGVTDQDKIPAYSMLMFDITLARKWSVGEQVPGWN